MISDRGRRKCLVKTKSSMAHLMTADGPVQFSDELGITGAGRFTCRSGQSIYFFSVVLSAAGNHILTLDSRRQ